MIALDPRPTAWRAAVQGWRLKVHPKKSAEHARSSGKSLVRYLLCGLPRTQAFYMSVNLLLRKGIHQANGVRHLLRPTLILLLLHLVRNSKQEDLLVR